MLRRFSLILLLGCLSLTAFNQTRNLDYYLTEGIHNSPLLNDYRNQAFSANSDSLLIKAARKPFIEGKSQLLYSPAYKNFGYDEIVTDGGNYTAVLSVSQNIFNRNVINNKYRSVDLQRQLVNNSSKISIKELNKAITDQYLIAYSALSNLLFNRSFLELISKENDIVKQFVKKGVYKQTDYLALLVETQSQEIMIKQLDNQYRRELSSLNQLCGLNDSAWYELVRPELKINGNPDISKSPGFIKFKIDSTRIETEKATIDLNYKAKINWFADAGFLTSTPWNFYRHFGYSAGISLNIPVYDGKQRGIEKQKLDFEQNTNQNYAINYKKQYSMQFMQLSNELKTLNETTAQTENQLKTSGQLVEILKDQLEVGLIQMTEYINAIKNYKTINSSLNLLTVQKLQVINEMNFLLTQ
jgi:outer membrane protein TolC